ERSGSPLPTIGFRKLAVAPCGAAHPDPARCRGRVDQLDLDTPHRLPNKSFDIASPLAVITDPAAFRRAVEGVDRLFEFFEKLFRHSGGKWCACGNAEPQVGQRRSVIDFAKCLVEQWDPREHSGNCAGEVGKNGAST